MRVERRKNFKDWGKILQTVQEIVPSDDFVLHDVRKLNEVYKAFAEDEHYRYEIVFVLVRNREAEREYRLLDFIWEEKHDKKGV